MPRTACNPPAAMDDAREAPSTSLSTLYASVVGDEAVRAKLPLTVAHELEERFMREGWPHGRLYGTEAELAAFSFVAPSTSNAITFVTSGTADLDMRGKIVAAGSTSESAM